MNQTHELIKKKEIIRVERKTYKIFVSVASSLLVRTSLRDLDLA
jgi:hypothetical protein